MELLHTNSEIGTNPEDIASGARSLGFDAEVIGNLTLDQVERFTADGNPVIALAQVWRSDRDADRPVEDEWDSGHYVVVLGVDRDYVYFQDPFIHMSKALLPRKTFEDHWHQVMGGDLERNPKLIHLGIIVRAAHRRNLKSIASWTLRRSIYEVRVAQSDRDAVRSLSSCLLIFSMHFKAFGRMEPQAECIHFPAPGWRGKPLRHGR